MRRVRTRVLPEPAPARIASGAASVVTASRCVASRPRRRSSTGAPYRRGVTRIGFFADLAPCRLPRRQPDAERPRVVSAASQLGSPRGRFRRSRARPSADASGLARDLRRSLLSLLPAPSSVIGLGGGGPAPHDAGIWLRWRSPKWLPDRLSPVMAPYRDAHRRTRGKPCGFRR